MSPSRASARIVFREHANAEVELDCHLVEHRLHDRGHARHHDYITDPEARRPRHLVEDEIRALGDARHAQARLVHLGTGRLHPFVQDGERARIAVDRHTERLGHAVGRDVTVGRSDPAGGEDIAVAMPERIECVDNRSLLVADHPHFLEIDAHCRQIFRDIADVLILVRPDRILPPITKSAAVTASLEADELAVGMDHLRVSPESWGSAV
jgi:hypothetical protein